MRTALRWGKQADNRPWIFVSPVANLVLDDAVERELRVDRVTFVHRDKLPYIRKRLGFYRRVSQIERGKRSEGFFKRASTYAIMRHTGASSEVEKTCLKVIRDELSLVNLSYLGYAKRRQVSFPVLLGQHEIETVQFMLLNSEDFSGVAAKTSNTDPNGLFLDRRWASTHSARTFRRLVAILAKDVSVHPSWRKELRKASILVGEGLRSGDLPVAFLKDMIALELLLTRRGDRISSILPTRARAFLGWIGPWRDAKYEERIQQIYDRRNALVHAGDVDSVRPQDLVFADDLVFNLMANLVAFPDEFGSKQKIIAFGERVAAAQKTGSTQEVRPKGLTFARRSYSRKDYDRF